MTKKTNDINDDISSKSNALCMNFFTSSSLWCNLKVQPAPLLAEKVAVSHGLRFFHKILASLINESLGKEAKYESPRACNRA